MKRAFLTLTLLASFSAWAQFNCQESKHWAPASAAQQSTTPINYNSRSDTADLVQLKLSIDTRDFGTKQLHGVAQYQLGAKIAFNSLRFDLLGYTVDSVVDLAGPLSFTQQGEHLIVQKSAAAGAVLNWTIYYHGTTTKDASGWGGMHHDGAYQYNLGVGFAANPHVYGRSLFPCFDNFVEKCTLKEMNITTAAGLVGVSNGILDAVDTLNSGDLVWRWEGTAPLPSYLVSLAVSDYYVFEWIHAGKPFEIYGRAQDTANIAAGFIHLNDIYDAFVDAFGPYRFEKVGYALTITGAMEHAGMIHLPRSLANAQLQGEDIIAHELAHMWFGNAITTEKAEDMWINEGFAEFGSHFYQEAVYGKPHYTGIVQDNQAVVLKTAKQQDGGNLALSGVNQDQTYGTHTYQKGAMVAHNLRMFLGDSLFNYGIQQAIQTNTFGNYDADGFKLALETATGVDLDDFWNEWIYSPGYYGVAATPFYSDERIRLQPLSYAVDSNLSTHSKSIPIWLYKHSYTNGYLGKEFWGYSDQLVGNGSLPTLHSDSTMFNVGWISINDSAESLGSVLYDTFTWAELTGPKTLQRTGVKITPLANPDSLNGRFYIYHYYGDFTDFTGGNSFYGVTRNHMWSVQYEGNHDNGLQTWQIPFKVDFPYNANPILDGMDADLNVPADSLCLRRFSTTWPHFFGTNAVRTAQGPAALKKGVMTVIPELGSYYAIGRTNVAIGLEEEHSAAYKIYPNPTQGVLTINGPLSDRMRFSIYNASGQRVQKGKLEVENGKAQINLEGLAAGNYRIELQDGIVLSFHLAL